MADPVRKELERLRAEVEAARVRELESLRTALTEARATIDQLRHEAQHFRSEANRNAEAGRQIADHLQQQIYSLRSEVERYKEREALGRRQFNVRGA